MSNYDKDHRLAKYTVCALVMVLVAINYYYPSVLIQVFIPPLWFFGINRVGYTIETIRHHVHKHTKF